MKSINSKLMTFLCIGVLSLIISGCGSDSTPKNETKFFEGQDVVELYIKTAGQDIEIRPSSDEKIKVSMNADKELPARIEGNVLTINIEESSDSINFKTETLIVIAPDKVYKKISLSTISGNITGEALEAEELTLTSDSGEIDVNGFDGDKINGDFVASNVRLEDIDGDLNINNETGNASVSHNGNFENESSIRSNTGKVDVIFKSKPKSLQVDVATESGKIKTSLFNSNDIIAKGAGNQLKAEIGSGGPTLSIRSSSGSININ